MRTAKALLLIFILMLALVGCSGEKEPAKVGDDNQTQGQRK